jgi:hypothetical protein
MTAPGLEKLSLLFERERWLLLPNVFDSKIASTLVNDLMSSSPRRVTVGAGNEWWDEYSVSEDSNLGSVLVSPIVVNTINSIWGREVNYTTRLWGQVYEVSQRIPWHTDGHGDIQFVLCLEAAPLGCGGTLLLRTKSGQIQVNLQVGDGLLFKATDLPHSTTPICMKENHVNPRRVVAVARFFITSTE